MIYLFEDRIERKKQYVTDKTFDNPLIKEKIIDCKKLSELQEYIRKEYNDAKVVLLHKSYGLDGKEFTIDDIRQSFKSVLNIPVILFSGGSKSNLINDNGIITADINSGVMYKNLKAFVDAYQKDEKIVIPILVYGDNYRINTLLEMQSKINIYLFDKNDNDILSKSNYDRYISRIFDTVRDDDELSNDINKIDKWIEGKVNIKIFIFKDQIQKLINRYRV